jgi:hypothetical protein
MTYDHAATGIHRSDVDRDIDTIRNERLLTSAIVRSGILDRIRRTTGGLLIAAGTALIGRDAGALRPRRA